MEPNALHAVLLLCAIIAIGGVAAMISSARDAACKRDSRKYALGPDRNEHGFPKGRRKERGYDW